MIFSRRTSNMVSDRRPSGMVSYRLDLPMFRTYAMPFGDLAERRREITAAELGALLSGIDLSQAKRRKRYRRSIVAAA